MSIHEPGDEQFTVADLYRHSTRLVLPEKGNAARSYAFRPRVEGVCGTVKIIGADHERERLDAIEKFAGAGEIFCVLTLDEHVGFQIGTVLDEPLLGGKA